MRAIVHSIHSQVPPTIRALDRRPDLILSLDSHLDVSLGGDYSVYPEELRVIAQRTSVHSDLRQVSGGVASLAASHRGRQGESRVMVAIPELMLVKHAEDVEQGLPPHLRFPDAGQSLSSVVEFLRSAIGIEVYQSPPKNLMSLIPNLKGRNWLLDVDVDYMREMQEECYTQIRGTATGVLQSMSNVIRFIEATKPETVTLSEAKVSAIRSRASTFSSFMDRLRNLGYRVEESGVYANDLEVERGISVCEEFYLETSRRLMENHMEAMMTGDLRDFDREEASAARDFFRNKGYSV
jgi:hypothetical protein